MTIEKLMEVFSEILDQDMLIKVSGIHQTDHYPDVFTISQDHEKEIAKTEDGILTEEICQMFNCVNCGLSYDDHTSTKQLVLQLRKDVTQTEAQEQLVKIKPALEKYEVSQVAFADTEEGYKFIEERR